MAPNAYIVFLGAMLARASMCCSLAQGRSRLGELLVRLRRPEPLLNSGDVHLCTSWLGWRSACFAPVVTLGSIGIGARGAKPWKPEWRRSFRLPVAS